MGLTDRQVDLRIERGAWIRRARNVFTMAGSTDSWQQRAMVAYLATRDADGVVSHVTAGAIDGVLAPSPLPHITVPPGRSPRSGVARIHRATVPRQDRRPRDGMWVTTPSRLLVDMAALLDRAALEELTDDVLCRRLASIESVRASLRRAGPGGRGHALLREVLAVWSEQIKPGSVAEVRLLRRLGELGVSGLVTQHVLVDENGEHVATLDIAAPDIGKGLEYDSVRYHNPRAWERDEPRYQRIKALGWDVEGVTKLDLVPGCDRLEQIAARWLAARAA